MKSYPLCLPFFLALFAVIFSTVFFPSIRLLAFAPFFAIVYRRATFISSLWITTLCGLILDVLSSQHHFGLYAFINCLTTLLMYNQKKHFFDDKPMGLSIFTAVLSIVTALTQLVILGTFDKSITFSWNIILTDIIGMSFLDALYAFLWFTCPLRGYQYIQRTVALFGWKALIFKRLKTEDE